MTSKTISRQSPFYYVQWQDNRYLKHRIQEKLLVVHFHNKFESRISDFFNYMHVFTRLYITWPFSINRYNFALRDQSPAQLPKFTLGQPKASWKKLST